MRDRGSAVRLAVLLVSLSAPTVTAAIVPHFGFVCSSLHSPALPSGAWRIVSLGMDAACADAWAHRREFPGHKPVAVVFPDDSDAPEPLRCRGSKVEPNVAERAKAAAEGRRASFYVLSRAEVNEALAPVRPIVNGCTHEPLRDPIRVKVHILRGGQFDTAEVLGEFAGTAMAECIERAVKKVLAPVSSTEIYVTVQFAVGRR